MASGKLFFSLLVLLAALLALSDFPPAQGVRAPFKALSATFPSPRRVLYSSKTCSDKYNTKVQRCQEKEDRCMNNAWDWRKQQKCTDKKEECEWDAVDSFNDCQAECFDNCDEQLNECYDDNHHRHGCDRKDQKCRDKCN